MLDTPRKFVSGVGFSKGCVQLGPNQPPPLVPSCLIATKAATDPNADPKKLVDDGVAKANNILKENAPKR